MLFPMTRSKRQTAKPRRAPRFLVLRRRWLALAAAGLAVIAVFAAVNYPAAVSAAAASRQLPIYCVQRDQKVCSISFDAAWGADNTQKILDVLKEYGVTCTFFVVGNWADQYPEQARAIVESGNELENHSNAHDHFNSLSADEIIADVNTCNDKIEALTGARPTLIRCPFGEYDDHVISAIRSIGMEPIQWDVEALAASGSARGASDTRAFCRLFGPEGRFKIQLLQIRRRIHIFLNRVLVVPHLLPENISRFKRDGYFFNKFIVI